MKIVIQGAGAVGSHLAKMLRAEGNEITVIDDNPSRLQNLENNVDILSIEGNPTSINVLKQAEVDSADLFIAVYPSALQDMNVVGAILAKKLGAQKVLARVNSEEYLNAENKLMFKELGIELMFYPEKIAADEIVDQIKHSTFSESMDFAHGRLQIAVFKLDENSPLLDLRLIDFARQFDQEDASKFRIIAVSRGDKTVIPRPDTTFQFGDLVFTIAKREGMDRLVKYFGKKNISVHKVMIIGGSPISVMVAKSLCKAGIEVTVIDSDRARCEEIAEALPDEIRVVTGDGRNSQFLYEEGIFEYDAFVALTGEDEYNILSCVVAKKLGVPRTVAEVENFEYTRLAEEMGVDSVINKKIITAGRIFKFTLSGRARFVKYMSGTDAEIIEYTVAPGSPITRKPLKELGFPQGAIIGGVIRGSEAIIAVGDTLIEPYDRVAIFALPDTLKQIDRFFTKA